MKHTMASPCPHCPFRTDIRGYLRRERVQEICESLMLHQQSFPCHKTTEEIEDDDGCDMEATEASQQCAGAEIFLAHQGASTQMGRIAARLGMAVAKLDMKAPVVRSMREMLAVHCGEEEEGEHCSVCNDDCEAPAGYAAGGGVIEGLEYAEFTCDECGDPVCGACSTVTGKTRVCDICMEIEEG